MVNPAEIHDLDQLKVMAYDKLALLEQAQAELRSINVRIAELQRIAGISPELPPQEEPSG